MAYNGDSKKIVSSSFLYNTLQSFYTKIKGLLDNKADKDHSHEFTATDADTVDGLHASSFIKTTGRHTMNADSDNSTYGRGVLTLQNETNGSKEIYPTLAFCQRGISDANLCMKDREFYRKTSTNENYYKI